MVASFLPIFSRVLGLTAPTLYVGPVINSDGGVETAGSDVAAVISHSDEFSALVARRQRCMGRLSMR